MIYVIYKKAQFTVTIKYQRDIVDSFLKWTVNLAQDRFDCSINDLPMTIKRLQSFF